MEREVHLYVSFRYKISGNKQMLLLWGGKWVLLLENVDLKRVAMVIDVFHRSIVTRFLIKNIIYNVVNERSKKSWTPGDLISWVLT